MTTARARGLRLILATVAVLLCAAGCGAGQHAETSQIVPAIPGADADAGPVALRDLLIPYREGGYPAGSDVPLAVRMFTVDDRPVTLTAVAPGGSGYLTAPATAIALRGGTAAHPVVPADGYLELVPGTEPYLVAERITAPLPYGETVPVRFTFSTGDAVTVDVPMAPPTYPIQ